MIVQWSMEPSVSAGAHCLGELINSSVRREMPLPAQLKVAARLFMQARHSETLVRKARAMNRHHHHCQLLVLVKRRVLIP